jgi:hypothetical protein
MRLIFFLARAEAPHRAMHPTHSNRNQLGPPEPNAPKGRVGVCWVGMDETVCLGQQLIKRLAIPAGDFPQTHRLPCWPQADVLSPGSFRDDETQRGLWAWSAWPLPAWMDRAWRTARCEGAAPGHIEAAPTVLADGLAWWYQRRVRQVKKCPFYLEFLRVCRPC